MKRMLRVLAWTLILPFSLFAYLFVGKSAVDPETAYGVTWSGPYAEELGIDPQKGLEAVLDDLGVKKFRIPAYWSRIEMRKGERDYASLRKQLDAIAERGGKAIVVVGATQPRWPECWIPSWAEKLSADLREQAQLDYLAETIRQFARHGAVEAWQVENEPRFFLFGSCKNQRKAFIEREMREIRDLDDALLPADKRHPIYAADSGELSTWLGFSDSVDGKGVSTYRVVLTSGGLVWRYWFLPPYFYARHAMLVKPWIKTVFVSEFQMEPWANQPLKSLAPEEQAKTFDINRMKKHFAYAERMRMPRIYFWGAEWWYWMMERKRQPAYWEEAKNFLARRKR